MPGQIMLEEVLPRVQLRFVLGEYKHLSVAGIGFVELEPDVADDLVRATAALVRSAAGFQHSQEQTFFRARQTRMLASCNHRWTASANSASFRARQTRMLGSLLPHSFACQLHLDVTEEALAGNG